MAQFRRSFIAAAVAASGVCFSIAAGQDAAPKAAPAASQPEKSAPAAADPTSARYMKVDDSAENRVKLLISSRTMVPVSGKGPAVDLVGVVHIADADYYNELQKFLDGFDLVLYEGVKPGGLGNSPDGASADEASKVKVTKSRLRMIASLVHRKRKQGEPFPESLTKFIDSLDGNMQKMAASAAVDAWGHPVSYLLIETPATADRPARTTFDLVSPGSDGAPGGEGAAADLKFSDQKPLTKAEKEGGEGMQGKLAKALGLQFQLTAINYTRPGWRNSDLAIDEVQKKLEESGASGDALFSLLDGSSFGSKMLSFLLTFVERDPKMAMMIKLMLVETVSNADALLDAQPGPMGKFMKVIVIDRNTAVLDDLRKVIDTEPSIKRVALFYGAGHLPDMEARMEKDFGYKFQSDTWFTAMDLDLASMPGGQAQAGQMRRMIRQMIEKQKQAAPAKEVPEKEAPDAGDDSK